MSDPTYDTWRAWRASLTDGELRSIHVNYLHMLAAELRVAADRIDAELTRRERPTDQQDARLYRPKGRP